MSTDSATTERVSFWGRQFAPRPTVGQVAFDFAFGIALPVVCLYFDPIVFRTSFPFGEPLVGDYGIGACVAIGLGLLSLLAWLVLRWPPALMAGLLAGNAVFATLLGFALLPISLIGLFAIIGVLGFSPFLTAFVFWRNAVRAYRRTRPGMVAARVLLAAAGLTIACGGPWAAQSYVTSETSQAIELVRSPDATEAARGIAMLKRFGTFINLDRLVFAYQTEKDEERRQRLAEAYKELTGVEIERRLNRLLD